MFYRGRDFNAAVQLPNIRRELTLASATAETSMWTPTTGKRFRLRKLRVSAGAASTLTFKDGTGLATVLTLPASATPITIDFGSGLLSGAVSRALTVTRSVATPLSIAFEGSEE